PEMDGATLLTYVQDNHPEMVRLVLSALASPELVFRTVPVAHQFLTKPFEPMSFRAKLRQAFELRALLDDPELRALVGTSNKLPSPPRIFSEISKALSNPETGVAEAAKIIESDVALSAQVVRLVSSAYFGLPSRVRTAQGAVAYLGFQTIKAVVFSAELFEQFAPKRPVKGFSIDSLQQHGLRTAHLARRILGGIGMGDDAFLAGMLHDVGRLLLAARAPEVCAKVFEERERTARASVDVEHEMLGVTHAEVGAYLLGIWGLPQAVIQAVAWHHQREADISTYLDISLAVSLANRLVDDPELPAGGAGEDPERSIDVEHLKGLSVDDRLESWREIARKLRDG
ncbi:MAG TPA: response regulator, partial [Polyangiaceae bacterium]|nr:response regulator [Polyangiaceae bacterium]